MPEALRLRRSLAHLRAVPSRLAAAQRSRHEREVLEFAASVCDRARDELRRRDAAEAQATHNRELLEWSAGISSAAEDQLRELRRNEAEQREAERRAERFCESYSASLTEWNEGDHPRAPKGTSTGGQWVDKGGGGATSAGTGRAANGRLPKSSGGDKPDPRMLDLAHAWWQTKGALERARRDMAELPRRIANERAQLGSGGRYAYIHSQNLAKAERDLEAAKALAPELEQQLADLRQEYHVAGYDEVPYATFTPAETIVGGQGIEEVGRAVAEGGTPSGLRSTGIEFEIASAALAAPAILRWGKGLLGRAGLKKGTGQRAPGRASRRASRDPRSDSQDATHDGDTRNQRRHKNRG